MDIPRWREACRAAATTTAAGLAAAGLAPAAWRAWSGVGAWQSVGPAPAEALEALTLALGTLCAGWIALTSALLLAATAAQALGARVPRLRALADSVAPLLLRRLVVAGLGAALGLAPQVAVASEVDLGWTAEQPDDAADHAPAPDDRGDVPLAQEPVVLVSTGASSGRTAPEHPLEPSGTRTLIVSRGDSLWTLTQEHLAATTALPPTDRQVAAAWPAVWAENRAVIGNDPDLLHPGQVLTLPADLSAAAARGGTAASTGPTDRTQDTDDLEENR